MAPRGKIFMNRVNVVAEGLKPFNFPKITILKAVLKILKNYGGEFGWAFIEEDSYKLVVETILADQEGETIEKKEENAEIATEVTITCNQDVKIETTTSTVCKRSTEVETGISKNCNQNLEIETGSSIVCNQSTEIEIGASKIYNQNIEIDGGISIACNQSTEIEIEASTICNQSFEIEIMTSKDCSQTTNVANDWEVINSGGGEIRMIKNVTSMPTIGTRKRPPCYGWISESEDESEETPSEG